MRIFSAKCECFINYLSLKMLENILLCSSLKMGGQNKISVFIQVRQNFMLADYMGFHSRGNFFKGKR